MKSGSLQIYRNPTVDKAPMHLQSDSRQTLVVVGNGMVGYRFCEKLVAQDANTHYRIVVFGEERYPAYDRVHLTDFFAHANPERLQLAPEKWYAENGIELRLRESVEVIDRTNCVVRSTQGASVHYDRLVLATGSYPFVPPINGINLSGVFVYRTIDDLEEIKAYTHGVESAAVIGGGLLGLEAARALHDSGLDTHIIEFDSRLMPRQLNADAAATLQEMVARMDINVLLNKRTTRITANGNRRIMHFADGSSLEIDMIVISAGIRPRDELARASGLACAEKGGIVVDNELTTSDARIYAIGECASHGGIVYGFVAPGNRMANVLVGNLMGDSDVFEGTDMSTTLKLMGVDLGVHGDYLASKENVTFRNEGIYRQLVCHDGRLVGVTSVGSRGEIGRVQQAIIHKRRLWPWNLNRFRHTGNLWRSRESQGVREWQESAIVCNCMGLTRGELGSACAGGCASVESLAQTTGASTVCGTCKPFLVELLGSAPTAPVFVKGRTVLLGASVAGTIFALLIAFVSPIPFSASVQDLRHTIDALWRDSFWKQVSGYSLFSLSLIGLMMPLRKRWKRFRIGDFGIWRVIHGAIGSGTLILLICHTGFRLGTNLNQILMVSFLALNLAGTMAGGITAMQGKFGGDALEYRWRNRIIRAHTVLFWPLPILVIFHIISVYYF